jgi:hypothetical protein
MLLCSLSSFTFSPNAVVKGLYDRVWLLKRGTLRNDPVVVYRRRSSMFLSGESEITFVALIMCRRVSLPVRDTFLCFQ